MNKYFITLLFVLSFCVSRSFAQYSSDSVNIFNQLGTELKLVQKSGNFLVNEEIKNYGKVDLNYFGESGDFRRAQQAYDHKKMEFYAEGFNQIGRFNVFGSFKYNQIWEDSLGNSLQGMSDDITPYYYFAGKYGKYERQNFDANVYINYELLKDKIYVGAKINYFTNWTTRSVDPRPEIKTFGIKLNPNITYRLSPTQQFSIGYLKGYGDEKTDIDYKNSSYKYSLVFPDRIHYSNHGYGYISIKDSSTQYRYVDYWGLNAHYSGRFNAWELKLMIDYEAKFDNVTYDLKSRKNFYTKATFDKRTTDFNLLLSNTNDKRAHQLWVNVNYISGKDWDEAFKAHSYDAYINNTYIRYAFLFNKEKSFQSEISIGTSYTENSKIDLAAAHKLEVGYIQPEVSYTMYKRFKENTWLKIMFTPTFRMPTFTNLAVPKTQENVFTQTVVYSDYYYFSSKAFGLNGNMQYSTRSLLKQYATAINVGCSYLHQQSTDNSVLNTTFIPNNNRISYKIGLSLYL